jgi:hypothetical protein
MELQPGLKLDVAEIEGLVRHEQSELDFPKMRGCVSSTRTASETGPGDEHQA